jgi:hypothetical protein
MILRSGCGLQTGCSGGLNVFCVPKGLAVGRHLYNVINFL